MEKIGVQLEAQGASEFSAAVKNSASSITDFVATVSSASASLTGFKSGTDNIKFSLTGLGTEASTAKIKITDIGTSGQSLSSVKTGSDTAKTGLTGLGAEAGATKTKVSDIGRAGSDIGAVKVGTDTAKTSVAGLGVEAGTTKGKITDIGATSSVWPAVKTGSDGAKTSLTGLGTEAGTTKGKVSDIGKAGSDITTVKTGSDTVKSSLTGLGTEAGTTKGKVSDVGKSSAGFGAIKTSSDSVRSSVSGLGTEAGTVKTKLSDIGKSGASIGNVKTGSHEARSSLHELGNEADKTKEKLVSADQETKKGFMDGVKEGAAKAKEKLVEFANEGGEKLLEVGKESVALAGNYQESMLRVQFLTQATTAQMQEYSKAAINIGMNTTFSSGKAADALAGLAQQGIRGKDAIDLLSTSANAAMTNNTDLTTATEQLTTVVKSLGQPLSKSGHDLDVMTKAGQLGKIQFNDFSDIMSRVGGVAQSSGQSFEEITAAILSMTNTGMSANQASNQLKGALVGLEKPNQVASKEIKALGLSISDSEGKMRPFSDIIAQLQEKTAGLTQEQKNLALANIFGKGNIVGITDAMNAQADGTAKGSASLKNWVEQLQKSDGTAKSAANTIMSGFNAAVKNMQGSFEEAQITIGTALLPALTTIVKEVTGIVNSFVEWEQETHTVSGVLTTLGDAAVIGFHLLEWAAQLAGVALKPLFEGIGAIPGALNGLGQALHGSSFDLGQTAQQASFLAQNFGKLDTLAAVKKLQETGAEFVEVSHKIYDANGQIVAYVQNNENAAQAVDRVRAAQGSLTKEMDAARGPQGSVIGSLAILNLNIQENGRTMALASQASELHRQKLLSLEQAIQASEKSTGSHTATIAEAIPVTSNYVSGLDTFHNSAVNDKIALDDATAAVNNFSSALNASQKDLSQANTLMNNLKDAAAGQTPEIQKAWGEFQTYSVKSAAGGAGANEARAKMAELRSELETAHNPKLLAAADAFDKEAQKAAGAKQAIVDNTVAVVDSSDKQEKLKAKVVDADQSFATLTRTLNSHAESTRTMTAVSNSGSSALNNVAGSASTAKTNLGGATTANKDYNAVPLPGKSVEVTGAERAINAYQAMRQALLAYNQTPVSPKNVPTPQSYAKGTSYHPGGMALVGEAPAGPELVKYPSGKVAFVTQPTLMNLPRGTQVFNPAQTAQMMARPYSTSTNINTSSQSSNVTNAPQFNLNTSLSPMQSQGVIEDFNMMRVMAGV